MAPGNEGLGRAFRRLAVGELEAEAIAAQCVAERVGLVVIGSEAPLATGVADVLGASGVLAFGPTRAAARLESSKWFAKEVMRAAGVATAHAESFEDFAAARAALARFEPPYVIKADGLAAGKGVRVTAEREAAESFLAECLESGRFGASGRRVVLEEFLDGEEVCDGTRFQLLPAARDYKRAYDGDQGPNTGGMGAYAPSLGVDPGLEHAIGERIVAPVLAEMARRGAPFQGALYCGVVVGPAGARVVEFNVRFGDPETQVVLPLLQGSLTRLLAGAAGGGLDPGAVTRGPGCAVAVALTDEGYPEAVRGGGIISGLDAAAREPGVLVFHATGEPEPEGRWRVSGGRGAYLVGQDATLAGARERAYAALAHLGGSGWRCRHDIAALAAPAATAEWAR